MSFRTQGLAGQRPKGLQSISEATRGQVTNRGQELLPKATLRGLFGSWAFQVYQELTFETEQRKRDKVRNESQARCSKPIHRAHRLWPSLSPQVYLRPTFLILRFDVVKVRVSQTLWKLHSIG